MKTRVVPAVARATAILFHLAQSQGKCTLSQIARDLGVLPSTCLHILRQLAESGLVSYDAEFKRYGLGLGVVTLAQQFNRQDPFVSAAKPAIERIARTFRMKGTASEADGRDWIVVVAGTETMNEVHLDTPVGYRVPIFAGATGRCAAAFGSWSDAQLAANFRKVRWQAPITFEDWRAEVEAVRRTRIAVDAGRYRAGITTMSTPILSSSGTATCFIGIVTISPQLSAATRKSVGKALLAAAEEIERELRM